MMNIEMKGHTSAFLTILIWGTTFISTKVLLNDFQPMEIIVFRFAIGFLMLMFVSKKRLIIKEKRHELVFALAGLCGISLYCLLENYALTYTMASNVSVIISLAPFFTAVFTRLMLRGEDHLGIHFFIGFLFAICGICMISFNGTDVKMNIFGDLLALLAAVMWALYSVFMKKISGYGYPTIQVTKRVFAYGLIFMVPVMVFSDFSWGFSRFSNTVYLLNILFLGLGASALCFVTWNFSVKVLGAVKSSIYIYMVPVITVLTSMIALHETITIYSALGIVLTLVGLLISENKIHYRKRGV